MILSIAPRLPPAPCGVGAYSYRLAEFWPTRQNFFHLVVDGASASRQAFSELSIVDVGLSSPKLLGELCSHQPGLVILHYSSRGYHPYGTPLWLSKAIDQWRKYGASADLVIIFHEVPSPIPFRSHHGAIYRINRYIIGKLCKHASIVLTNTPEHAHRLKMICDRIDPLCVPVPSNIIVPRNCIFPFDRRNPTDFLIFGLPFTQLLTIKSYAKDLAFWASVGLLRRLHLVGPSSLEVDRLLMAAVPTSTVIRHGFLPDSELSHLLQITGFCLTQATELNYYKSTTFMAYASHGCPTVARFSRSGLPSDLLVQPSEVDQCDYFAFAQRAADFRNWYFSKYDWPIVARKISSLLKYSESET